MKRSLITLLTDFGTSDHYVAAMKGVMLGICPAARLVDISHEIEAYAIPEAAYTLAQAWPCFPKGTVHLVVVDPGVGSARRPILVEAAGQLFVGPDNGVFTLLYDAAPKHKVREISATRYFRQPVSQTFHGRDIFAPVSAHLACDLTPGKAGKRIEDYVRLDFARPARSGAKNWTGTILTIDRFGNVITNFESAAWEKELGSRPFEFRIGARSVTRLANNYAEMPPGELFVIAGSAGYLEVSTNRGSAGAAAEVKAGGTVELLL